MVLFARRILIIFYSLINSSSFGSSTEEVLEELTDTPPIWIYNGDKVYQRSVASIGMGSTCLVYKATLLEGGSHRSQAPLAIRVVVKNHWNNLILDGIKREFEVHAQLHHPNVLPVIELFEDEKFLYYVVKLAEYGDLSSEIGGQGISENYTKSIFVQLVNGIKYLHNEQHIVHRDLKLENIMVGRKFDAIGNNENFSKQVMIADFGFAIQLPYGVSHITDALMGTPGYIAPEVLTRRVFSYKSDIFALGVILYVMLTGDLPPTGIITRPLVHRLCVQYGISIEAEDLLASMLKHDFRDRIMINQIETHPWLIVHQDRDLYEEKDELYSSIKQTAMVNRDDGLKNPLTTNPIVVHG